MLARRLEGHGGTGLRPDLPDAELAPPSLDGSKLGDRSPRPDPLAPRPSGVGRAPPDGNRPAPRATHRHGPGGEEDATPKDVSMPQVALTGGVVLEAGRGYRATLRQRTDLSARISGGADPRSTTGRVGVCTRLITDYAPSFDRIEPGYRGPLYAEICPQTFPVLVRKGSRLNQLRIRHGSPSFGDAALRRLHEQAPL